MSKFERGRNEGRAVALDMIPKFVSEETDKEAFFLKHISKLIFENCMWLCFHEIQEEKLEIDFEQGFVEAVHLELRMNPLTKRFYPEKTDH